MKLFGFLQIIFERQGPEKGTFIFLLSLYIYLIVFDSFPQIVSFWGIFIIHPHIRWRNAHIIVANAIIPKKKMGASGP